MRGRGEGGKSWESWGQGIKTRAEEVARLWKQESWECRSEKNLKGASLVAE